MYLLHRSVGPSVQFLYSGCMIAAKFRIMTIEQRAVRGTAENFVICDTQKSYSENLFRRLSEKLSGYFQFHVFHDIENLKIAAKSMQVNILLIGEEPVVEEPVRVEPKKVEAVQPQKAAAEKKADEPQKAAFEKAVEKEVKEEVKKETKLVEVQPQTIEAVEDFLKNTMKAMDMEVELKTEIDQDGALCVDMSGEHMGILIGKRGQTLDSLQYLANRVANKHQEGYVRVKLDTENYRARREETLRHLAKNIAHKVKRNRRPVALEPMNPYERRIIHSALQSDPYVMTHSEGEEPFRKVVITLKK